MEHLFELVVAWRYMRERDEHPYRLKTIGLAFIVFVLSGVALAVCEQFDVFTTFKAKGFNALPVVFRAAVVAHYGLLLLGTLITGSSASTSRRSRRSPRSACSSAPPRWSSCSA
jgi:hypothetical protein